MTADVQRLRSVPAADVYKAGRLAARLERGDGASTVDLEALPFHGSPLRFAERELRQRRSELTD
ncbi:hypothetical protein [Kocuria tytonis]|uniref:Uncharacterized protein n=1 Tax=Kocuria tytonis TaxID=2054280 RepID=A0A495A2Q1_9MICC|nr:hypothetical protein [Kocuria tytonis]RKQ33728.1 hypothetical protein C1C97_011000 [Kocuria tytonis]